MFLQRCFQWLFFFLLCLGTLPPSLLAARVGFSWLPNTEPTLAGYRIHYGTASRTYTTTLDVGLPQPVDGRIHTTVTGLVPGETYFFAATAYDVNDMESGYSVEVSYTVPVADTTPPKAADGTAIGPEDSAITGQLDVSNSDGLPLQYTVQSGPTSGTLSIEDATGFFTYTPLPDFSGSDSFTFTASNANGESNPASIAITVTPVNDTPVPQDAFIATAEDTPVPGRLAATDPDGDTLTFTLATPPARGSVTIDTDGAFTYTPAANANGTDTFTFAVSDGTASAGATVTLTINPVNDPPAADSTSITVDRGTSVSGVLSASDSDGDALSFTLAGAPAKGSVTLAADGSFTYRADSDATGNDSFSFTASDGHAASAPATVTVTINELTAALRFETGELQVTSAWQAVTFDAPFRQPVVIARATSLNDPDPGVIRVRNVTTTGFEVRFQEWDSLDGDHAAETVTYMAMEQGSFTLDNGTMIEAGCFPATAAGSFIPVDLAGPMRRVPVVMTTIDTVNEADAVTARIRNITSRGFEIMLQEQEANPARHASETGCYIAWEPSAGTIGNMAYEVATTGDEITHNPVSETFSVQFPRPPLLLAQMESTDGPDTAVLRIAANSVTGATFLIREERSRDAEEYHTTETGGMIAICTIDPSADPDGDGLTTAEETETYHTHPGLADTDGDTIDDGEEVAYWQAQGASWDDDVDGDGLVNLLDTDADGDGISDGTEVAGGTDPGDPASAPTFPAMDAGELTLDHNRVHVDFATPFARPVVVARLVTRNGGDPSVLRIANVSATGFDIRLQEFDYLDGVHTTEQVDYLVMEAGHYILADGTQIEAGTFDTAATSVPDRRTFSSPFARVPVVVTAIVSANEADTVTGRLRNIGLDGFDFRMQEQESNQQLHARESVAYIAWEPSAGTVAGIQFAVGRSANSITSAISTISYGAAFAQNPLLLTDMQTTDGGDTAALRTTARTADAMQVMVEEERSRDTETAHTTEVAGYIAILAE